MELEEDEERLPVVPLGDRKLRACLVTGLVKTEEQASLSAAPAKIASSLSPAMLLSGCGTETTTSRAWV